MQFIQVGGDPDPLTTSSALEPIVVVETCQRLLGDLQLVHDSIMSADSDAARWQHSLSSAIGYRQLDADTNAVPKIASSTAKLPDARDDRCPGLRRRREHGSAGLWI